MPQRRTTSLPLPEIRFPGGMPFRAARERTEALALIRRLAVTAYGADDRRAIDAMTMKPLSGGRSAARVFELTPYAWAAGLPGGGRLVEEIRGAGRQRWKSF